MLVARNSILIGSALLALSGMAQAIPMMFHAELNGAQEVPAKVTAATGSVDMNFDTVSSFFDIFVHLDPGLSGPITGAHIHSAAIGVNGPVIFAFNISDFIADGSGGYDLNLSNQLFPVIQQANLLGGNTYVNIHTQLNPGGEIRGQLQVVPTPGLLSLLGIGLAGLALLQQRKPATVA